MKWNIVLALVVLIQIISTNAARLTAKQHITNYKKYQSHHQQQKQQHQLKKSINTAAPTPTRHSAHTQIALHRIQQTEMPPFDSLEPQLEIDTLKCPVGCVCQYAHFDELSISRWIQHMQARRPDGGAKADENEDDEWGYGRAFSSNEADSGSDSDGLDLTNPYIKQATCILQEESNVDEWIHALPHDLHALILLYTSSGQNKSVNLSTLKPLNQLTTLEVRGGLNRSLRLYFDEPLSFLQHANFESVTLLGSDAFKRPKNPIHPKDSFDYKPRSEAYDDVDADGNSIAFAPLDGEDDEYILPYDLYKQELIKARMPTFYGWEHLEVLRIHGCELNQLQWEMFDGLKALEHLSLERNGIVEVPPFSFYGAMHIQTLSLAQNSIRDIHYRALAGLLELQTLDLSNNRLEKLSERSFPPFPKMVCIDFRNNPLRYILPASFWVMNSTRAMDFDSLVTPLMLRNNQPFDSLLQLETLHIGNVSIGSLEQNMFKGLTSLEKLTLRGKIRSIEFDAFAGLVKLRELELSHCGIQEISMDALMDCESLEVLDLSYNNISYFPPGLLDDQSNLEEIYLQGNQLRALPISFFLLPRLRLARLIENPWECNCDMNNWRPKITNQERGPRSKRCITDYASGKQISCRRVDSYVYDNRFAPRCANHNQRSVFYVLRKQLKCGTGHVVVSQQQRSHHNSNNVLELKQRMPHWRKIEENQLKLRTNKNYARNTSNQFRDKSAKFDVVGNLLMNALLQQERRPKRVEHTLDAEDDIISNEI
ncbi:insulin-like growth factor-binding protein complex acid labile subunit [Eurosta solidaginis]|uniref:insulin-like growth factor-binding protein complex acid labile subunit n=1 Tax=Eurosta solidaginis TaxID=178769 RepID=UPI003530A7DE